MAQLVSLNGLPGVPRQNSAAGRNAYMYAAMMVVTRTVTRTLPESRRQRLQVTEG